MIIRQAELKDANAIALVHVDAWTTTYSGILPSAYIGKQTYAKRCDRWEKMLVASKAEANHFIYVAEFEGEIIGFVDGGTARSSNHLYKGEIYALYILEAYQRQGLGRNLTLTIARQLSHSGLDSILVWVLADNSACKFYQSLGGQEIERKLVNFDGSKFQEIAYGWQDTQNLIASIAIAL